MKFYLLALSLFFAMGAFAQDFKTESDSSFQERTADGYRIIRIDEETVKNYQGKNAFVKRTEDNRAEIKWVSPEKKIEEEEKAAEEAEMKKPLVPFKFSIGLSGLVGNGSNSAERKEKLYSQTEKSYSGPSFQIGATAQIPLTEYNYAIKLGVFYEYNSFSGDISSYSSIDQSLISIPAMIAIKPMRSTLMFEGGVQVSFPISFKVSNGVLGKVELKDKNLCTAVGVQLILGMGFILNDLIDLDLFVNAQINSPYKSAFDEETKKYGATFLRAKITFKLF